MGIPVEAEVQLAAKFESIFPYLDERQRRLLAGAEARVVGHGGIRVVARAAGMREGTVSRGVMELEAGEEPSGLGSGVSTLRHQLLTQADLSGSDTAPQSVLCVRAMLLRQLRQGRRNPDAIAVSDGGGKVSSNPYGVRVVGAQDADGVGEGLLV
jgi:hypothetical protein